MADDLEKERAKHTRKIQQLRNVNHGLAREIEELGGGVDLTMARMEHLVEWLADLGIISEDQRLDEAEAWERHLRPQLIQIRDRIKENRNKVMAQAREQQRRMEAQQKQQAQQQQGNGLILPFKKDTDGETRPEA